jgi:hypothetical protein
MAKLGDLSMRILKELARREAAESSFVDVAICVCEYYPSLPGTRGPRATDRFRATVRRLEARGLVEVALYYRDRIAITDAGRMVLREASE